MSEINKGIPLPQNTVREEALKYVALGFSVMPLGSITKDASGKKVIGWPTGGWKKYQDSIATQEEVASWNCQNLGIVTGHVSGLLVLDVDSYKEGFDAELMNSFEIPITPMQETASGGRQYFFKLPDSLVIKNDVCIGSKGSGIDIRGDGGMVIAPPSTTPYGEYTWTINPFDAPLAEIPPKLLALLTEKSAGGPKTKKTLTELVDLKEGEGRNNAMASFIGKLLATTPKSKWETEVWSMAQEVNRTYSPPLSNSELRSVYESITRIEANPKTKHDTNGSENREEKPILRTSIVTKDALYEMVYDHDSRKTSFFKKPRFGEIEAFIEEVEINGQKHRPIPPTYNLLDKSVILFPSTATLYKDEAEILAEIQTFIHKYVDISEVFEQIATYYVLFTWMFDRFNEVPYLRAIGDFGSGKSRFIQAIGILCYKPIFTGGATTPSPIFRIVNEVKGTLIIDEADFKFSDMTSEIVKILNTGYQKGMPVLRSEGKGTFEVKAYDVYCPKIVATRETFSDKALESRFLVEEMGAGKLRADIPRTLEEDFYVDAEKIRNKLLMWRFKNYFEPLEKRTEVIEGIHPRLNQIVIPLLSVIKDEAIKNHLKAFIIKYNAELVSDRGLSWESDIVFAILKIEHETGASEVTVKQIADEVNKESDLSDNTMQARKVGWYLRTKLQLKPYKTRKGFVLPFKANRARLDMWKERFGITDADIRGEDVNNVDVVNNAVNADVPAINEPGF